jgi:hypothetical protein
VGGVRELPLHPVEHPGTIRDAGSVTGLRIERWGAERFGVGTDDGAVDLVENDVGAAGPL